MVKRNGFRMTLLAICIASMLLVPFVAGAAVNKHVAAGRKWIVSRTTRLSELTIAKGAAVTAAKGHSVTMTVDGVETSIKPGTYKGNIVLTVTKQIIVHYRKLAPELFRTAVYIDNGKYVADKSVAAAVTSGTVANTVARDVKITSNGEKFNGILATGNSKYTYSIINPVINFNGNGGNDFAGFGAAVMSSGKADVTVNNAKIDTRGAIRTAVFVGGHSTMHVNNSDIEAHNGILPKNYVFKLEMGKMMEVPWMLGITGNCRATNVVADGTAYYTNTHVRAQGWGALSTDDTKRVRLHATKCLIETVDSGYGAYSIGDCIDTFSACTFNVHDMGLIMANEKASGIFTDGTVVNSGRFGVVMHSGGWGTLVIDKGSVFNTKAAVILAKSSFPTIIVDNAKLKSQNGIILQAMVNDDPYAGKTVTPGVPFKGAPAGKRSVKATFKNVTLKGDIINSMTSLGDVIVTFKNATITGAITTATAVRAGEKPTPKTYYLIGKMKNTYCATNDKYGMKVFLDGGSTWVVAKTSYLTGLRIAKGDTIKAPEGYHVVMTIDGASTPIKPGAYRGKIVLAVSKAV